MKPAGRLAALLALAGAVGAVFWVLARRPTPDQPMSLEVVTDRGTEAMQLVDRFGKIVTRLPVREEIELGRVLADRMAAGYRARPGHSLAEFQGYVREVVRLLAAEGGLRRPEIPYEARVLPTDLVNAYALPGGFVFVTSGLLELIESEAELAAVLGHEIAHVDLGHCVERIQYQVRARAAAGWPLELMVAIGSELWTVGFADELEAEADRRGALYGERAGYHPEAAAVALERLAALQQGEPPSRDRFDQEVIDMLRAAVGDYFATHPPAAERLAILERSWREQRFDLERGSYYLGRRNYELRIARSRQAFPEERITGRLQRVM